LRKIEASSLKAAFNVWHASQLEARQKERVRYSKEIKPVLKFIYSTLVTSQEDKGVEFELEHVYPVAVLKRIISDNSLEGLPMAAIGNLMLLPKKINRIKKENLLGDYILDNVKVKPTSHELEALKRFLIQPDLEDISEQTAIQLNPESFISFCEERAKAMVEHLTNSLNLT
jgi:hypothetical protein